METGKGFQWPHGSHYTGNFHSKTGYSREYATWIEEQYLNLFNNSKSQEDTIKELEDTIRNLEDEINYYIENCAENKTGADL